ncbi:MAG TPA: tetratricopeptide repeat protein, partial [Candidatus Obscuribacterales bacterium]
MNAARAALAWLSGSALGVGLALSVGVAPAAHAYANPARDEARAMMRRGDFNDALTKLSEAVGLNPDDPENYLLRGKCFFHMQNFELAIQDFNKVLQFSPNYYQAFLWRGTAHAKLGNDDLAIKDYEQAIRLRPQLASRYFGGPQDVRLPGTRGGAGGPVADYKEAMRRVYPSGFDPSAAPRQGSPDPADVPDEDDYFINEPAAPVQSGARSGMAPVLDASGGRAAGQAAIV